MPPRARRDHQRHHPTEAAYYLQATAIIETVTQGPQQARDPGRSRSSCHKLFQSLGPSCSWRGMSTALLIQRSSVTRAGSPPEAPRDFLLHSGHCYRWRA
jgi:hypothetical protein